MLCKNILLRHKTPYPQSHNCGQIIYMSLLYWNMPIIRDYNQAHISLRDQPFSIREGTGISQPDRFDSTKGRLDFTFEINLGHKGNKGILTLKQIL